MTTYIKDPQEVLDYGFDWSDWLETGDTVDTSDWTIKPSGLTEVSDSKTDTTTMIWVSGGTVGSKHKVTNRVLTADNRTVERSFYVKIQSK